MAAPEATDPLALRVGPLSKTFVGQRALDAVAFDARVGEVHALVGHNGSGKSTLIKVVAGYHEPDPGSGPIEVDGRVVRFGDPDASHAAGLRFIHQELGLVDDLTILENLRLGAPWETGRGGRIRWSRERDAAAAVLAKVGLHVHPDLPVFELTAVERTQVAVARAIQDEGGARVLFFDEPTATLPSSAVDRLFDVIEHTVDLGIAVVYVSHRLEELPRIADRVTVLRNGVLAGSGPQAEFPRERLVELIVGSTARERVRSAPAPAGAAADGEPCLRFDDVAAGELSGASFEIRPGELVGMAGLVGSGVNDVPQVLLGKVPLSGGTVAVCGEDAPVLEPHALGRLEAAVLPSARALRNIGTLTVRENLTLPELGSLTARGRLNLPRERVVARELIDRFGIQPAEPERMVEKLSGGNQQKVGVAKWLRTKPRLLVLDEPTQGVDVGGKAEILALLRSAAADGVGVLICSSDVEELADVCQRVLIVRGGRIGTELQGARVSRETIAEECYRDDTDE